MRTVARNLIASALFFVACLLLVSCAHSPYVDNGPSAESAAAAAAGTTAASTSGDSAIVPVEFGTTQEDQAARVMFLKLGAVDQAENYEIQIRPKDNAYAKPKSILTARDSLRLRVIPGNYEVRTRSIAASTARGGWGEWRLFTVPFRAPVDVFPKPNAIVPSKSGVAEKLSFEWPKNPKAKAYRFKLYDDNKVLLRTVVTAQNWNLEKLDLNRSYHWSVQPMSTVDEKELPGIESTSRFTFSQPLTDFIPVEFTLAANPRAILYQSEFARQISGDEFSEPTIFESRESQFKTPLEPGHYRYRTRSINDDGSISSWSNLTMLLVSIPRPVALTPSIDEIIDPKDDVANKIEFTWKEAKWAASYLVSVYSDGALVASAEPTENHVVIDLPHSKIYRWSVVPRLSTSKTREPASTYEPDEQDGTFTVGEYIKLNLAGSEEPSQLYAWTRFIYSDVAYMSDNFDRNSRIRQSVLVSSAEVAGGYWYRKTDYGGLVSAQISGIDIGGTTGSFNQYSALLGYRMELSEQRRLRFWIGPSIKETPELVPSGFTRTIDIRSIKTLGASALVAFFNSFTENFGVQVYGGSFYGMKGLDTPNGLDQKSFISFFASLYGTYKFSKNMTSLLGVTYQSDTAGYKSADRSGSDNRVLFAGNYISLSFIFGLQEPEK